MKKQSYYFFLGALFLTGWISMPTARATEPLDDYSFVRGVCYGMEGDQKTIERDLEYAQRLRLNSTRIWLDYNRYRENPKQYLQKLQNYVRTANRMGISTMPILFNGNMMNPDILKPEFRSQGDAYVKDVVNLLKNEPGLFIWDVMNEPTCNDYCGQAPAEEREKRLNEVWDFVHHYCKLVKEIDPKNALTVGVTVAQNLERTAEWVDVFSFHDYSDTRQGIQKSYDTAKVVAEKYGKPLINSETGCPGRANSYDMAIKLCEQNGVGWYLFNLVIGGYWGAIHGIVYPDGTVRDPSIIAALFGFYRNRNEADLVRPNPNMEGKATAALSRLREALEDDHTAFRFKRASSDLLLDAMEVCANLLEGSEMVPMYVPPTAKIKAWRAQAPQERDIAEIRQYAYELAGILRKSCQIF